MGQTLHLLARTLNILKIPLRSTQLQMKFTIIVYGASKIP